MVVVAIVALIVTVIASPKDADKEDQRDREINRLGEYKGQWFVTAGAVTALGMAALELDHFWIANVLYLALVLSTLLAAVIKIVAHRRGF
jgi:cell division protein FtsW (lipid II flippase)